jgi:hypothetical protein
MSPLKVNSKVLSGFSLIASVTFPNIAKFERYSPEMFLLGLHETSPYEREIKNKAVIGLGIVCLNFFDVSRACRQRSRLGELRIIAQCLLELLLIFI